MNDLRESLAAERPCVGAWVTIASPVVAELMGKAGYAFAVLDTQHGSLAWSDLLPMLQALDLGGTRALVRVGWTDPMQIMRALDLGAVGVIVPMVSTAGQARTAAQACRYPPSGVRSFGPVRDYYGATGATKPEPLCMVMIETAEAMANLDAIAATEGVDGLFVGPVDLAFALGHGAALTMPAEIAAAVGEVVAACRRHGKVAGCATLGTANAEAMMATGVRFVTLGSDAGLVRKGAASDVAQIERWRAVEHAGAAQP